MRRNGRPPPLLVKSGCGNWGMFKMGAPATRPTWKAGPPIPRRATIRSKEIRHAYKPTTSTSIILNDVAYIYSVAHVIGEFIFRKE